MTTKHCNKCGKSKPMSAFCKSKARKDGLGCYCKECSNAKGFKYKRTKFGIIVYIYGNQRSTSKRRLHDLPDYTSTELREWALSQSIFHVLYDEWVLSGYEKDLVPSFDRLDDYKPYTLDNLQITTWLENYKKGCADRKNGANNKHSKAVVQMTMNGSFIKEYHSEIQASRMTGIRNSGISRCCLGERKTSGGFRWIPSLGIPIANNLTSQV